MINVLELIYNIRLHLLQIGSYQTYDIIEKMIERRSTRTNYLRTVVESTSASVIDV